MLCKIHVNHPELFNDVGQVSGVSEFVVYSYVKVLAAGPFSTRCSSFLGFLRFIGSQLLWEGPREALDSNRISKVAENVKRVAKPRPVKQELKIVWVWQFDYELDQ